MATMSDPVQAIQAGREALLEGIRASTRKIREGKTERAAAIRKARAGGVGWRDIAKAAEAAPDSAMRWAEEGMHASETVGEDNR